MLEFLPLLLHLVLLLGVKDPNSLTPLFVLDIYVVLLTILLDSVLNIPWEVLGYLHVSFVILITQVATIMVHLSTYNLGVLCIIVILWKGKIFLQKAHLVPCIRTTQLFLYNLKTKGFLSASYTPYLCQLETIIRYCFPS